MTSTTPRRLTWIAVAATALAAALSLAFYFGRKSGVGATADASALGGSVPEDKPVATTGEKEGPAVTVDYGHDVKTGQGRPSTSQKQRPSLSDLISDENEGIIGDVSFLLDFAIVGHSKTATTAHMTVRF